MKKSELNAAVARIKDAMRNASQILSDADALGAIYIFEVWSVGKAYRAGDRIRYGAHLYRVRQDHTAAAEWKPTVTPALYEVIALPGEDGTAEHPIAYNVGMTLENGKYYTEAGTVYRCTRDTGAPVYHTLQALVGIYTEVV